MKKSARKSYLLIISFILSIVVLFVIISFYSYNTINKNNLNGKLGSENPLGIRINLIHGSAPLTAYFGNAFEISCDFNINLPCIIAKHGDDNCTFKRFDGTTAVFSCTPYGNGLISNYCNIFYYANDSRCFQEQINKIRSTNVVGENIANNPSIENVARGNSSLNLISASAPDSVDLNENVEIRCDFGIDNLPCIGGVHGNNSDCSFVRFDGTTAVFSCTAKNTGLIDNYCNIFYYANDSRCLTPEVNKIQSTNVLNNNGETIGVINVSDTCEKKICTNGCKDDRCIININEAISKKNTLVFAGVYPGFSLSKSVETIEGYVNNFSPNINGLGVCCDEQTSEELENFTHSKGYILQAGAGSEDEAIKAANNKFDIIIFDEIKLMSGKNGRPYAFSGSEFNKIKEKLKKINPNIKVGIVEAYISDYITWYNEGANPDIIGLEQYITNSGESTGGYPSYDEFKNQVMNKFPNAQTEIWINDVSEIDEFIGKVNYLVLFGVDSYKIGSFGDDWPNFKIENIENQLKVEYGNAELISSFVTNPVFIGNNFIIKCNFGGKLPCIIAKNGENSCNFLRFDGTTAVFSCEANRLGKISNYCDTFSIKGDNRCFDKKYEIQSSDVKVCSPSCSRKVCGDDFCGGSCGVCLSNQICDNGKCTSKPCNNLEKIFSWFGLKKC